jgi:predicted dehydrogenase
MIQDGAIGEPMLLMETFVGGHGLAGWNPLSEHHYPHGGPGGGGMGMMDHGIHLTDVFPWLAGSDVDWVFGRGNVSGEPPRAEHLTMQMGNGAVGQLIYCEATFPSDLPGEGIFGWGLNYRPDGSLSSTPGWESQPGNIRVHGTEGALRIYHYANKLFYFAHDRQEQVRVMDRPHPGNFALQMESFASSILRNEEPEVTGEDGLRALSVVLAAYESARTCQAVAVGV